MENSIECYGESLPQLLQLLNCNTSFLLDDGKRFGAVHM